MKKLLGITLLLSLLLCAIPAMATEGEIASTSELNTMYLRYTGVPVFSEPKIDLNLQLDVYGCGYGVMWAGRAIAIAEYGEEWCKVKFSKACMTPGGGLTFIDSYAYIQTKHMSVHEMNTDQAPDSTKDPACTCSTCGPYQCATDCPVAACIANR